jgi:hypothetical protein
MEPETNTPIPNAPNSSYAVSENLVTLTIPVEVNVEDLDGFSQYFDGQFVATYEIPPGLDGDHNEDGAVDAADYVAWRKDPSAYEPDGYGTWREHFGEPASEGAQSASYRGVSPAANFTVPEPTSVALLALVAMLFLVRPNLR